MKITEIYDLSMYPKGTIFYGVNKYQVEITNDRYQMNFLIEDLMSGVICKECNRKSVKGFYEKNKEKIKENRKEYSKEYYEKNKES